MDAPVAGVVVLGWGMHLWRYGLTGLLFTLGTTAIAFLFGRNPAGEGLAFDPLAVVVPSLVALGVTWGLGAWLERRERRRRERSAPLHVRQSQRQFPTTNRPPR